MVAHFYNARERRWDDHELKASLAYIVRPYLIFNEKIIMMIIITAIIKNLK